MTLPSPGVLELYKAMGPEAVCHLLGWDWEAAPNYALSCMFVPATAKLKGPEVFEIIKKLGYRGMLWKIRDRYKGWEYQFCLTNYLDLQWGPGQEPK